MTKRQTIIAIHGSGMQGSAWAGVMPHMLDHDFRTLTLPGHDPQKPDEAPLATIADMATWLKNELESMDLDKPCILLGHSMGALVALESAMHPQVAAVILVGAASRMPVNPTFLSTAQTDRLDAEKMMSKWSIYPRNPKADAMRTVTMSLLSATKDGALAVDLKACDDYLDVHATARRITKSVLVVTGAADKMVSPEESKILSKTCVNGRFVQITDCGHMIMVEKPLELAFEMKQFLKIAIKE